MLVSAETVHDFQLQVDDPITLRLRDLVTKQYTDVAFHYVGIAKEFPTAPHGSFLLANAGYVAAQTGSDSVGAFLVDTGSDPTAVADRLRAQLGATATVTDIVTTRAVVGSSLTAADLDGLTKVELGFALALAAAATGLTLWLGLTERRRTFSIAAARGEPAPGRRLRLVRGGGRRGRRDRPRHGPCVGTVGHAHVGRHRRVGMVRRARRAT